VRKKIASFVNHTLFKGSLIILVGTTVGNFLNYLYHLVTGRLLTPSEYGLLQSLISLTYFQSIIVGAYSTATIEKVSSTDKKNLPAVINGLEKNGIKLSLIYWLITLLSYPLIKSF
jgi:O-antigen/teichoic acid export membrane protein